MKLECARGVRDIDPQDQLIREKIITEFKTIFSRYGFIPLDTPIIERYDILSAKFAAGEESDAMSEVYTLKDNGNRKLGLRFDLTLPLARYVGMNKNLKLPFKRYQIGKVYRDAPVRAGRYREFTQCDVDIVGTEDMLAEATCISIAIDAYKSVGIDVKIQVNNRSFLTSIIQSNNIPAQKTDSLIMTLDKLDKIGVDGVIKESSEKGLEEDVVSKIIDLISVKGSNAEKLSFFRNMLSNNEGLQELEDLFSYFNNEDPIEFTPTLARGLGYYTGTVFEVVDMHGRLDSSIGAGGRYDNMIGNYLESEQDFPAVGISFGLDRIVDVLKKLKRTNEKITRTKLFIVPINTKKESFAIAQRFRKAGINTDIDMKGRGPSKNFKQANKEGIPYVGVVGEDELAQDSITIKEMASGKESRTDIEKAISLIRNSK
ncbi:MAG: histidine--tRNA ligase [Nanoarchaeota archaeon]